MLFQNESLCKTHEMKMIFDLHEDELVRAANFHWLVSLEDSIPRRGVLPLNFGQVCATKGLKPWPYLRMNQTKIDTLFKAQTRKMTPYGREEQKLKIAWMGQLYFISVWYLEVNIKHIMVD